MWERIVWKRQEQKTDFSGCALHSFDCGITCYINNIKKLNFKNPKKLVLNGNK